MFPFSASYKKNFPSSGKVETTKEKNLNFYINMYPRYLEEKVQELAAIGINVNPGIINSILSNLVYYDRLNVYILFLAYTTYYQYDSNPIYQHILTKFPEINETKLNFEINTYLTKIDFVLKGGITPYVIIH
jgi:hypothetical protein